MRLKLNGRVIRTEEPVEDEPPTEYHVLKRLIGRRVSSVSVYDAQNDGWPLKLRLEDEDEKPLTLAVRIAVEKDEEEDVTRLFLEVDVVTRVRE